MIVEICAYCRCEVPSDKAFRYSAFLPFCTFGCSQAFKEEEGTYIDPEDLLEDNLDLDGESNESL
jgi:hypothetical protein